MKTYLEKPNCFINSDSIQVKGGEKNGTLSEHIEKVRAVEFIKPVLNEYGNETGNYTTVWVPVDEIEEILSKIKEVNQIKSFKKVDDLPF